MKFIRVVRYEGSSIFTVFAQVESGMWVIIDGFGSGPLPTTADVTFFARRNGMKRVKMVATKKLGEC